MSGVDMETYRRSLALTLRHKNQAKPLDEPVYVEAAKRVLDLMNHSWQEQKLCDVLISTANGDVQAHRVALGAYSKALATVLSAYNSGDIVRIDLTDFQAAAVIAVLRFLYTTELELDCNTVSQVLTCANELGVTDVVRASIDYILRNCDIGNALLHLSIADSNAFPELRDHILRFILDHFSEIAATKQFVYMSPERLRMLLTDDRLCIAREIEAFDALVRWINFDRENRQKFAPGLLECIRFPLMSLDDMINSVEPAASGLFKDSDWRVLYEAMKAIALRANGRMVPQTNTSNKPRACMHPRALRGLSANFGSRYSTTTGTYNNRECNEPEHGEQCYPPVYSAPAPRPGNRNTRRPPRRSVSRASFTDAQPENTNDTGPGSMSITVNSVPVTVTQQSVSPRKQQSRITVDIGLVPAAAPPLRMSSGPPTDNLVELVAFGGLDLQSTSDTVPGKLVFSYNSPKNVWEQWPVTINGFIHNHGVLTVGPRIYIVGGTVYNSAQPDNLGTATDEVNVYDLSANGVWYGVASMQQCRAYVGVASWQKLVFAVGGEDEFKRKLDTIEVYHPENDQWSVITHIPSGAKVGAAVAVLGDFLYVVGGFNPDRPGGPPITAEVERFNVTSQSWTILTMLTVPRCHASLVQVQGKLYLIGGRTRATEGGPASSLANIEEYDEVTDRWIPFASLRFPRHGAGCCATGSLINVVGGMQSPSPSCLTSFECFDVASREYFERVADYPYPVFGLGLCAIRRKHTVLLPPSNTSTTASTSIVITKN